MSCVVPGCKSHSGRKKNDHGGTTYHRFPHNQELRNVWLQQISKKNWTCKNNSRICSKHFTLNSFYPNQNHKGRRLKSDAVPTLHLLDINLLATECDSSRSVPMDIRDTEDNKFGMHDSELDVQRNMATECDSSRSVPMDIRDTEDNKFEMHDIKLEVQRNMATDCDSSRSVPMDIRDTEDNKFGMHDSELDIQRNMKSPSDITQKTTATGSNSICFCRRNSYCKSKQENYEKKIRSLQQEVERIKNISKRRLRKINTLTKRLSRLSKKKDNL